jgi:membrane-bound lytic murein transglycosylase D
VLLVPSQRASAESEATLGQAVFTTVPQGRTFYYRVRRGDSMTAIASRYAVTTQEIRGWNSLPQNNVTVGQQLRITSDLAPNASKAKRSTGKRVLSTRSKEPAKPKTATGNGGGATKSGKRKPSPGR